MNPQTNNFEMNQQYIILQNVLQPYKNPYSHMNGLEKLKNVFGIFIKQVPQYCKEALTCDCTKIYDIYATGQNGYENPLMLFQVNQNSNCCCRVICPYRVRSFDIEIVHSNNDGLNNNINCFYAEKINNSCLLCCCCRPEVKLYWQEAGNNKYLGKILYPCKICCQNVGVEIYNEYDQLINSVLTACCQSGFFCPCVCLDDCQNVQFDVLNSNVVKVSTVNKESAACVRVYRDLQKNIRTSFAADSTPENRALMMTAMIFLDFWYFNVEIINRCGDIACWSCLFQ